MTWRQISALESSDVIAAVNLNLPATGFTHRTLQRMKSDPLHVAELSEALLDPESEICGLKIVSHDAVSARSWMQAIFCSKGYETEFTARLKETIGRLARDGSKEVRVSDRTGYHYRAGIDRRQRRERIILESLGFTVELSTNDFELDLNLFHEFRPKEFSKKEVFLGPPVNTKATLQYVSENFSPGWTMEAAEALKNGGIVEARIGEKIIGFCCYSAFENDWFGPVGVSPEHRASGVGTELLFTALTRMREAGIQVVTIPWTELLSFYVQTNAIVGVRLLDIMHKQL